MTKLDSSTPHHFVNIPKGGKLKGGLVALHQREGEHLLPHLVLEVLHYSSVLSSEHHGEC